MTGLCEFSNPKGVMICLFQFCCYKIIIYDTKQNSRARHNLRRNIYYKISKEKIGLLAMVIGKGFDPI